MLFALKNVTLPDGAVIGMTYDSAGRVKQMDYPQGTTKLDYDPTTGQIHSASNAIEGLTWGYDGPLVTSAKLTGAVSGTVGYTYDDDFRLKATTVNGGSAASFDYDNDGLLTGAGGVTLRRDPDNGLLRGTTAGTVTEGFDYNTYGELKSYTAKAGSSELLAITYVPDSLGRIRQKVETIGDATTTYDYGYDAANRLHEVKQNGVVVRSWDYDEAGNRKSETKGGTTVTATYDAQDRLQTYGAVTYTFGKAGDLQSRTDGTKTTGYVYDALGNLISAQLPDGTQLDYVVDAQGRRVGKKVNGRLVQGFLWESQLRIAAELDGSGKVVSRFVYGTKVNVPELVIKGSATYRVIADHLGSPRLVVNTADGTVAQRIDYDEWGNVLADSRPGFQPFGFAGGLYDRDLELVRFGARDYEPATGRWTRQEPMMKNPRTVAAYAGMGVITHSYVYAANNPMYYVDFDGYSPVGWIVRLGQQGQKWVVRPLFDKAAAVAARLAGKDVQMATRQGAREVQTAACKGQKANVLRHKGHKLRDGSVGDPHYQGEGMPGRTFWGGLGAFIWGMVNPFDAITGELGSDDTPCGRGECGPQTPQPEP